MQKTLTCDNYVYLCSPIIGERLRIPVDWGVNSGVFGRAQRFVNRQSKRSLDLQPSVRPRMWVCART